MQKRLLVCGMAVTLAMSVACADHVTTPAAPSASLVPGSGAAAADEVTLKVTAPTQQSPQNGAEVDSITPNLVIANATAQYAEAGAAIKMLKYRFAVETAAGVSVHQNATDTGDALTGFRIPADLLERGVTYRWRARAELNSSVGPWSAYWTFTTPKSAESLPSFQTENELWDNLADGKTIGAATNVRFVAGRGAEMPDFTSHISYTLRNTLTSGVMQFLIENLDSDTNGAKTKVVSMQEGYSDFTDNQYRFNVEKRGDDHPNAGAIRMRIITGDPYDFSDSDRFYPDLSGAKTYYFRVAWGNGRVECMIRENGPQGALVLHQGINYQGAYAPDPHVVHIGVPVPRGGPADATVPGIIVRYFHVSDGRPWPGGTGAAVAASTTASR